MTKEERGKSHGKMSRDMKARQKLHEALKMLFSSYWIPCKEHLPDKYGEYLVTWSGVLGSKRQKRFIDIFEYEPEGNYWINDRITEIGYKNIIVHAWQVLPEVYEE